MLTFQDGGLPFLSQKRICLHSIIKVCFLFSSFPPSLSSSHLSIFFAAQRGNRMNVPAPILSSSADTYPLHKHVVPALTTLFHGELGARNVCYNITVATITVRRLLELREAPADNHQANGTLILELQETIFCPQPCKFRRRSQASERNTDQTNIGCSLVTTPIRGPALSVPGLLTHRICEVINVC